MPTARWTAKKWLEEVCLNLCLIRMTVLYKQALADRAGFAKSFFSAFIVDSGIACYVWIGKGASPDERKKGMEFAHVCETKNSFLHPATHGFFFLELLDENGSSFCACYCHYRRPTRRRRL